MPRKTKSKVTKDIYIAYVEQLLKDNPEYWSIYKNQTRHHTVYKKEGSKVLEVITYPRFRSVIESWCWKASEYVIEGKTVSFGYEVGQLAGRVVDRNFSNLKVDWGRTKKRRAELGRPDDKTVLVFWMTEDWCRIGWKKSYRTRNANMYKFTPAGPTASGEGFRQRFSRALIERPTLKNRYEHFKFHD